MIVRIPISSLYAAFFISRFQNPSQKQSIPFALFFWITKHRNLKFLRRPVLEPGREFGSLESHSVGQWGLEELHDLLDITSASDKYLLDLLVKKSD